MVRLTDHLDMTIAVDWDTKPQTKQKVKTNRMRKKKMDKNSIFMKTSMPLLLRSFTVFTILSTNSYLLGLCD